MTTNEIRDFIKKKLEIAYNALGYNPKIILTTYPASETGNTELEKEAKAKGDNGIIYIGRDVRQYGERSGGLYSTTDPFIILIYSSNKNGDQEINDFYDIARDCLITFMKLESDYIMDVKGYKSDMYMAWIRCSWEPLIIG